LFNLRPTILLLYNFLINENLVIFFFKFLRLSTQFFNVKNLKFNMCSTKIFNLKDSMPYNLDKQGAEKIVLFTSNASILQSM